MLKVGVVVEQVVKGRQTRRPFFSGDSIKCAVDIGWLPKEASLQGVPLIKVDQLGVYVFEAEVGVKEKELSIQSTRTRREVVRISEGYLNRLHPDQHEMGIGIAFLHDDGTLDRGRLLPASVLTEGELSRWGPWEFPRGRIRKERS